MCVVIGFTVPDAMAPESVSFRITRNAEDLAQTIHALSRRLITLEQHVQAMALQLDSRQEQEAEPDLQEISSLDNVERLLHDCRCLLDLEAEPVGHGQPEADTPLQTSFSPMEGQGPGEPYDSAAEPYDQAA